MRDLDFAYVMILVLALILLFVINIDTFFRIEYEPQEYYVESGVDIIEFIDFQCPICRDSHLVLKQVIDETGATYELRHFPVHDGSKLAAVASECARDQGKFTEYAEKLFATKLHDDVYIPIAIDLGLDTDVFARCLGNPEKLTKVEEDTYMGLGYGVRGTPTFIIKGQKFEGMIPYDTFKSILG